jgi:hypothetical protein
MMSQISANTGAPTLIADVGTPEPCGGKIKDTLVVKTA